jgi:pimeloyl-ACP methyl ester carboxylesterase
LSLRRTFVVLVVLLAGAGLLGHRSGNQPPRDAVAAAERELGIELRSRRIAVGEVTLHVVEAGPETGPPVVLLHGFPEFWYAWRGPLAHLAAAGFRAIAPDQRGYNASDKPPGVESYRIDRLADDIADLVGALGYEDVHLAAHDWGGGVAWHLAIHHPERVRKLVMIDTPHPFAGRGFRPEEESVSWYRTFFQIPWLPEYVGRLGNWRMLSGALRDTSRPDTFPDEALDLYRSAWDRDGAFSTMVSWYRAAFRYPPDTDIDPNVRVPTLLVLAPDDAFIPSDLTRRSLPYMENGRLLELEQGTHWVIQEDPERIGSILAEFFSAPDPQPL